jgi:hypothetical protein
MNFLHKEIKNPKLLFLSVEMHCHKMHDDMLHEHLSQFESNNQPPNNQPTNQPISHSINQSISQPAKQCNQS